MAAYAWLLAQGIEPKHIVFAGDLAGGGLSVTSQILARQRRLPVPAGALLPRTQYDRIARAAKLARLSVARRPIPIFLRNPANPSKGSRRILPFQRAPLGLDFRYEQN